MWILPVLAVLAFVGYLAADIALHFLPTGLNPVQSALSHYATSPYRRVAQVASLSHIGGVVLLCVALTVSVGIPPLSRAAIGALALVAATRLGARIFPLDAPGTPATWHGRVHFVFAAIIFVASAVAIERITRDLGRLPRWHPLLPALTAFAQASLWLLAVTALTWFVPPLRRVFGLGERMFMLVITAWLLIVSGYLSVLGLGVG